MMGMDVDTREKIGRAFAKKIDAWYLDSRDLPMGHLQPQQARWLRVVAKAYDRNDRGHIVTSGYFATAESREQYRIEPGRVVPDFSVYVDTIAHDQFHTIPGYVERVVHNVDDHSKDEMQRLDYWEEPTEADYDLRIGITNDPISDSLESRITQMYDAYIEKMKTYKIGFKEDQNWGQ